MDNIIDKIDLKENYEITLNSMGLKIPLTGQTVCAILEP